MKLMNIVLFLIVALSSLSHGTVSVVDFTQIRSNLINAKRSLVEQILQVEAQYETIRTLVTQVKQVDDWLDRYGSPVDVDLESLKNLHGLLNELPLMKSNQEIISLLEENYLFEEQPGYKRIGKEISVDGESLGELDESQFTPELMARKSFSNFDEVKYNALIRYSELSQELKLALQELDSATTTSEVQKLQIVISTLNAKLKQLQSEIEIAASSAQSRFYQNEIERQIARKARAQKQRTIHDESIRRAVKTFPVPNTPILFEK